MTANDGSSCTNKQKELSRSDVFIGAVILACAQLACASTASCVHSLPEQTPSVLRGLWRQTLTSIIFATCTLILLVFSYWKGRGGGNEALETEQLLSSSDDKPEQPQKVGIRSAKEENDASSPLSSSSSTTTNLVLVILAVVGATLQNDTIVVALQYASSAAVMCLCNTTPIWLILYAIVYCGAETPGIAIIAGAGLSLVGAIICATAEGGGEGGGDAGTKNESLGAVIATIGGIGGAMYMTACCKIAPIGINPIILTLIINIGMMIVSLLLCLATIPGGITASTSIEDGFFGFFNPQTNPAALLLSLLPDCLGNFGIMIALSFFEPLIVSLVMLTEPLNASLIAMIFVGETPPSARTVLGVIVVLMGCGIVLWESSKEGKAMEEIELQEEILPVMEEEKKKSVRYRRMSSQTILFSPIGTVSPDATATAAFHKSSKATVHRRFTLPAGIMTAQMRQEVLMNLSSGDSFDGGNDSPSGRITLATSLTSSIMRGLGQRLSFTGNMIPLQSSLLQQRGLYGTTIEEDDQEGADM